MPSIVRGSSAPGVNPSRNSSSNHPLLTGAANGWTPAFSRDAHDASLFCVEKTTSGQPSRLLPYPTIGQTVPGYDVSNWWGVFAPKGTPREVLDALFKASNDVLALAEPVLQHRMALTFGARAEGMSVRDVIAGLVRQAGG